MTSHISSIIYNVPIEILSIDIAMKNEHSACSSEVDLVRGGDNSFLA